MASSSETLSYLVTIYCFRPDRTFDEIPYFPYKKHYFRSIDILDDMQSIGRFFLIDIIFFQFILIVIGIEQIFPLIDPIEKQLEELYRIDGSLTEKIIHYQILISIQCKKFQNIGECPDMIFFK